MTRSLPHELAFFRSVKKRQPASTTLPPHGPPGFSERHPIKLHDDGDITSKTSRLSINDKFEDEDHIIPKFDLAGLKDEYDGDDVIREFTRQHEQYDIEELLDGHMFEDTVEIYGALIRPGMTVDLIDGDFLRVKYIIRDVGTVELYLKGVLMRRTRKVNNMLPKKYNELCIVQKTKVNAAGIASKPELVTKPISSVVTMRRTIFTNQSFPAWSFREGSAIYSSWADVEDIADLVCRWKYTEFFGSDRKVREFSLEMLADHECDRGKGTADKQFRQSWRSNEEECLTLYQSPPNLIDLTGHIPRASKGKKRQLVDMDLTADDDSESEGVIETSVTTTLKRKNRFGVYERRSSNVTTEHFKSTRQPGNPGYISSSPNAAHCAGQYTYGDICTGAGGMLRGAQMAGLKLVFGLDHWSVACDTLRRNFHHLKVLLFDIFDFCMGNVLYRKYMKVDILHISFPCQPHSSLHTVAGKRDEANIAAGYSAIPILEMCRPRIVTLEQTPGIMTHNDGTHFNALIHQLASMEYSMRCKIVNCADYGNVQARKRLIIIASAPGEPLPPFPAPTHGIGRGLLPFTTMRDILSKIPRYVELHMQAHSKRDARPYNDRQPLKSCITTSGGESNTHPSGKRSFILQELAQLQGFPAHHLFAQASMTDTKRQIGNAVPACFGEALYKEIIKSLRKSDRKAVAWEPEVIHLD